MAAGRHDAGRHAEQHRHQRRRRREEQGRLGPVQDGLHHGPAQEDRGPQVPLEEPPVPAPELDEERPVQPQLAVEPRHVLRRGVGAGDHARRVAGGEVHEHERHRRHHQHDRHQGQEAPDDVDLHWSPPYTGRRARVKPARRRLRGADSLGATPRARGSAPDRAHCHGRPVSINDFAPAGATHRTCGALTDGVVGRDGALWVSDDHGGRIYRVRYGPRFPQFRLGTASMRSASALRKLWNPGPPPL